MSGSVSNTSSNSNMVATPTGSILSDIFKSSIPQTAHEFSNFKTELIRRLEAIGLADHLLVDLQPPLLPAPNSTSVSDTNKKKLHNQFRKDRALVWEIFSRVCPPTLQFLTYDFAPQEHGDPFGNPHAAWAAICNHFQGSKEAASAMIIMQQLLDIKYVNTGNVEADFASLLQAELKLIRQAEGLSPPLALTKELLISVCTATLPKEPFGFLLQHLPSDHKDFKEFYDNLRSQLSRFLIINKSKFKTTEISTTALAVIPQSPELSPTSDCAPEKPTVDPSLLEALLAAFTKPANFKNYKQISKSVLQLKGQESEDKPMQKLCYLCNSPDHLANTCPSRMQHRRNKGPPRHNFRFHPYQQQGPPYHQPRYQHQGPPAQAAMPQLSHQYYPQQLQYPYQLPLPATPRPPAHTPPSSWPNSSHCVSELGNLTNQETEFYCTFGSFFSHNFVIDSGASKHICNMKHLLKNLDTSRRPIMTTANGSTTVVDGIGSIGNIHGIFLIPSFVVNLISVSELTNKGMNIQFTDKHCVLMGKEPLIIGTLNTSGLYIANENIFHLPTPPPSALVSATILPQHLLWHNRLNHLCDERLALIGQHGTALNFNFKLNRHSNDRPFCTTCALCKAHRTPSTLTAQSQHQRSTPSTTPPLSRAYISQQIPPLCKFSMDIKGKFPIRSKNGKYYILIVTCIRTRYRWGYFLSEKSDTLTALKGFTSSVVILRRQLKIPDNTPWIYKSDNGGEFIGSESKQFLEESHIQQQLTSPHSPYQNGIAERGNRTLSEAANSILMASHTPAFLWHLAWQHAVYIENRLPTKALPLNTTPYQELFSNLPDFKHLRIFGCTAFNVIPPSLQQSDGVRSVQGRFVGYDTESLAYLFYNPLSTIVSKSGHLIFDENIPSFPQSDDLPIEALPTDPAVIPPTDFLPPRMQLRSNSKTLYPMSDVSVANAALSIGFFVDRRILEQAQSQTGYLTCISVSEALHSTEHEEWKAAINLEINSLNSLDTWDFIDHLPQGQKALGYTWVLKQKPDKKRARLTVKGCGQMFGRDFQDTFAPVAKLGIARMIMATAAQRQLYLFTMDVSTAFPNASLEEDIFMIIPPEVKSHLQLPTDKKYIKLKKALYGLKQASREWYCTFSSIVRIR